MYFSLFFAVLLTFLQDFIKEIDSVLGLTDQNKNQESTEDLSEAAPKSDQDWGTLPDLTGLRQHTTPALHI